jgi:hypothetical protein
VLLLLLLIKTIIPVKHSPIKPFFASYFLFKMWAWGQTKIENYDLGGAQSQGSDKQG